MTDTAQDEPDLRVPSAIREWLYLGSEDHFFDEELLKKLGITHVLSCVSGSVGQREDVVHFRVPMSDTGTSMLEDIVFAEAFPWLMDTLQQPDTKVLVHCHAGINRSATVVVGFLMFAEKLPLKKAHQVVESRRGICIHDDYMKQLREYDKALVGEYSTAPDELPTTSSMMRKAMEKIAAEHAMSPEGKDGTNGVDVAAAEFAAHEVTS